MIEVPLLTPDGRPYLPLPAQEAFHKSSEQNRAYIGAYGCGKTMCGAVEALLQSLEAGPGGVGMITRYDWHELELTTWKEFLSIIPAPIKDLCVINQRPPKVVFPNGFVVVGFNLKNYQKLGSFNLSWAWIDEVNEDGVEESAFLMLRGRLRNPVGRRCLWLTGNPGGRNWVWRRFFAWKDDKYAKRYASHEGFRAGTKENVYLPADYIENLKETYPEDWLEKFFAGDDGIFEGQILTEFDPEIHVVPPFERGGFWPIYRGIDHGLTHPTVCLWATCDPEGNTIFFREHVKKNISPADHAGIILTASSGEEEQTEWTVIDPSTRQRETAGGLVQRIIDQYRDAGLYCREGNNDVKPSVALIKRLLQPDKERVFPRWHPMAGQPGSPWLFMTSECPRLRWEAEQWRWKDIKPGQPDREKPLAVNDDAIAAARYILMERPREAVVVPKPGREQVILEIIRELAEEKLGDEELIGQERI